MSKNKLFVPKNKINFDTPNRATILKTGLKSKCQKNVLGKGSYGIVIEGIYKENEVAVKIIETSNEQKMQSVKNEGNMLGLWHNNIISILKIEATLSHSVIIMEKFAGYCLQYIIDQVHLSLHHRLCISLDTISGINFCHSKEILHLDIKPQNILVAFSDFKKIKGIQYTCKLCDFGSSIKYNIENNTKFCMGTIRYMSPEALRSENLTPASDIYSFAITLWQIKARLMPYYDIQCNETVAYKVVKDNLRPTMSNNTITQNTNFFLPSYNNCTDCICKHFSNSNYSTPLLINSFKLESVLLKPSSPYKNKSESYLIENKNLEYLRHENVIKFEKDSSIKLIKKYFSNEIIPNKNYCSIEKEYDNLSEISWNSIPFSRPNGEVLKNQLKNLLNKI